ncbi:unnamed protein product [Musa acuminata subsp. malaccensis]|uniref:(wild Malaysian banana) hypothetical protein n=1 Tax=Musa acuminata subsp. malaccensis TaxID=214687 RepID=A0A804IGR6_MUSAM|nr:unnamed protein product [Musa acuminata subsp. malaccensis]
MAYLSQVRRRRLFELLQEQQEPFLLDVYLLERGYSDRLLASQSTCPACWPGNPCRMRTQKLTGRRFRTRREGTVKNMLSKLFSRRATKNALHWIDTAAVPHVRHTEKNKGFALTTKVLDIFNELLKVAYTPAFYQLVGSKRQFDRSDVHLLHREKEADEESPETTGKFVIPRRKKKNKTRFTRLRQLIGSEMSSSGREWGVFQPQASDIGAEIEATIFEDIKEEVILEMMGSHCTSELQSGHAWLPLQRENLQKHIRVLFLPPKTAAPWPKLGRVPSGGDEGEGGGGRERRSVGVGRCAVWLPFSEWGAAVCCVGSLDVDPILMVDPRSAIENRPR